MWPAFGSLVNTLAQDLILGPSGIFNNDNTKMPQSYFVYKADRLEQHLLLLKNFHDREWSK